MRFDKITEDERLWAVRYDGMDDNILYHSLHNWVDYSWLHDFFVSHASDLNNYFRITDLDQAIFDTISDAIQLHSVILDLSPERDLNALFRPLENYRSTEMVLGKEKAKGFRQSNHASWLRLYAIKLDDSAFLITGGAIKLTRTMKEREHTIRELNRLEEVRNYLIEHGVADYTGAKELFNNE